MADPVIGWRNTSDEQLCLWATLGDEQSSITIGKDEAEDLIEQVCIAIETLHRTGEMPDPEASARYTVVTMLEQHKAEEFQVAFRNALLWLVWRHADGPHSHVAN
jgi:hypothetical protein